MFSSIMREGHCKQACPGHVIQALGESHSRCLGRSRIRTAQKQHFSKRTRFSAPLYSIAALRKSAQPADQPSPSLTIEFTREMTFQIEPSSAHQKPPLSFATRASSALATKKVAPTNPSPKCAQVQLLRFGSLNYQFLQASVVHPFRDSALRPGKSAFICVNLRPTPLPNRLPELLRSPHTPSLGLFRPSRLHYPAWFQRIGFPGKAHRNTDPATLGVQAPHRHEARFQDKP